MSRPVTDNKALQLVSWLTEKALEGVPRLSKMFIVVVLLFWSTASAQQIYKWKDEQGKWHFSNAPTGKGAEVVDTAPQKTSESAQDVAKRLRDGLGERIRVLGEIGRSVNRYSVGYWDQQYKMISEMRDAIRHYEKEMRLLIDRTDKSLRLSLESELQIYTQHHEGYVDSLSKNIQQLHFTIQDLEIKRKSLR